MKLIFVYLIKLYQITISPLLGVRCRFHPSCSNYSQQAIETYGVVKGIGRSVHRLCRCHPFNAGGYDPVVQVIESEKL